MTQSRNELALGPNDQEFVVLVYLCPVVTAVINGVPLVSAHPAGQ